MFTIGNVETKFIFERRLGKKIVRGCVYNGKNQMVAILFSINLEIDEPYLYTEYRSQKFPFDSV